jgi:mono/diheme cytochrome c family protein
MGFGMMQMRWAGGVVLGTGLALAAGLAASANAQATYEVEPRAPQYLYDRTCGYCHGHNVGPIILGRQLPAAVVSSIVRSGNGAMPAFKPTEITNQELQALAAWIQASPADSMEHGQ